MAIDWEGVKKGFEAGECSIRGLARENGCHESTIRERAKKEGWKRPEPARKEKQPECLVTGEVIDDHRALWKVVKKRLVKGLNANDAKLGLEELKVAKTASEVLPNVIKGERLAWGLEENSQEGVNGLEEITREMASLTVPSGAEEALDGE